jgi:hypothetical protein
MGKLFSSPKVKDVSPELPLVFQTAVGAAQEKKFASWNALYGPYDVGGDLMSSLYAEFDFEAVSTKAQPINVLGGIPLEPASSLFEPHNIVIAGESNV